MITWQDDKDVFGRLYLLTQSEMLKDIRNTIDQFDVNLADCFSWGQLKSKQWLINNLPNNLGTVFICGGWYGTLAAMMFNQIPEKFEKIRSFDIDSFCAPIADSVNKSNVRTDWKFKASTLDIHDISYPCLYITLRYDKSSVELTDDPDTIINTSCEHIDNFSKWYNKIPSGRLAVLQSNNYFDLEEHINCAESLEEFSIQTPMTTVLYEGELDLGKYKRFMRIGYK
jgi:hypothetical protein